MASGTGLHSTPQKCLEALSQLRLDGVRVLDVGTGAGILAIAAAKRGSREVVAVDTDPRAVSPAPANAKRNEGSLHVRAGSRADVAWRVDVSLPNLLRAV